jgi:hypothetical protein
MRLHFLGKYPVDHTGRIDKLHTEQSIHQDNHSVFAMPKEIEKSLKEENLFLLTPQEISDDWSKPETYKPIKKILKQQRKNGEKNPTCSKQRTNE